MMRFFLISCFLLIFSCGSYPKKEGFQLDNTSQTTLVNPYFSNSEIDYVYKSKIEIYDNQFGGLLIIKKISDHNHRVAFTTEMGNKLFDFSFTENDFKVNYIVDDFDKGLLIKILKQDFKTLITESLITESQYQNDKVDVYETVLYNKKHFYFYDSHELVKINRVKGTKEKVSFIFSNINDSIADKIVIEHYNIKLKITLKSIN